VYEHIAVIPQWSAAPPKSLSMHQGDYRLKAENFWMMIHPITLLLMIVALILNWKNPRRKNIMITLGVYFLILVITTVWFVPELISITGTIYQDTMDETLTGRAGLWEMLSIIRMLVLFVLCVILLAALLKSDQVVQRVTASTNVPLNYPNDALGG